MIRSLNDNKSYARFVEEQLAGDILFPEEPQGIVATGFSAAGPWDFVGHMELREDTVDKRIARLLDRDDMVMTAMSTFASLTVHCARCHDHKFDPIKQSDYYISRQSSPVLIVLIVPLTMIRKSTSFGKRYWQKGVRSAWSCNLIWKWRRRFATTKRNGSTLDSRPSGPTSTICRSPAREFLKVSI